MCFVETLVTFEATRGRRRGRGADIPRSTRGDAAAAARIFRGALAATPRRGADIPRSTRGRRRGRDADIPRSTRGVQGENKGRRRAAALRGAERGAVRRELRQPAHLDAVARGELLARGDLAHPDRVPEARAGNRPKSYGVAAPLHGLSTSQPRRRRDPSADPRRERTPARAPARRARPCPTAARSYRPSRAPRRRRGTGSTTPGGIILRDPCPPARGRRRPRRRTGPAGGRAGARGGSRGSPRGATRARRTCGPRPRRGESGLIWRPELEL